MTVTVAVTGGPGSGKSTVCERLRDRGAVWVSADALARDAVAPGTPGLAAVVRRFGDGVLADGGTLDRRRLRRRILADPVARRDLERIVHPEVVRRMDDEMAGARRRGVPLFVAEIPLLFEGGLEDRFDQTVAVVAGREAQIRRLMARDAVDRAGAEALLDAQMKGAEKAARADRVIENRGGRGELLAAADRLYAEWTKKAPSPSKTP